MSNIFSDPSIYEDPEFSDKTSGVISGKSNASNATTGNLYSIEEIKELGRTSLDIIAALCLGEDFSHDFSEAHYSYWELLTTEVLRISDLRISKEEKSKMLRESCVLRYAFGLPRGFAKTTLMKLFTAWCMFYTDFSFFLIVSAAKELAENYITDVCDYLDSENVRKIFGNWRANMLRDKTDLKRFTFNGATRTLLALGAESSLRGINIGNERPEVVILEDAQSKVSAESPVQNANFIKWFLGTLSKAVSPRRSLIAFIGNMYNEICCLNKLRENPQYTSFITSCILAGKRSLWPEFRSYESLIKEFENDLIMGQPSIFLAEMMNDPLAEAAANFDISKIHPYPYHPFLEPEGAFITIDPALGLPTVKNPKANATCITLHHVIDGKDVIRKIRSGQWDDEQTIHEALSWALAEGVSLIAVEGVAYQAVLCNIFVRKIMELNLSGIEVIKCMPNGLSKNVRIGNMLRKILGGFDKETGKQRAPEIEVHPDARPQLFFQAARFKPTKTDNEDDVLDSAAYGDIVLQEHWMNIVYHRPGIGHGDPAFSGNARVFPTSKTSPF